MDEGGANLVESLDPGSVVLDYIFPKLILRVYSQISDFIL